MKIILSHIHRSSKTNEMKGLWNSQWAITFSGYFFKNCFASYLQFSALHRYKIWKNNKNKSITKAHYSSDNLIILHALMTQHKKSPKKKKLRTGYTIKTMKPQPGSVIFILFLRSILSEVIILVSSLIDMYFLIVIFGQSTFNSFLPNKWRYTINKNSLSKPAQYESFKLALKYVSKNHSIDSKIRVKRKCKCK